MPLTVPVSEVHPLDNLAHGQEVRRRADDVEAHPRIPSIERRQRGRRVQRLAKVAVDGALDVGPGGNDGAEHHEAEGEECQRRDAAAEPQNLAVGDGDDGQVLEYGVDGHRQELERLGARVDHADK